jgi:hypothetical protein
MNDGLMHKPYIVVERVDFWSECVVSKQYEYVLAGKLVWRE